MARNDKIFIATYPDGRRNIQVRIGLNADLYRRAMRSHGSSTAIEGARKSICIQIKKAIGAEYGHAPRWIEWERLNLQEVADNTPPPPPSPPTLF